MTSPESNTRRVPKNGQARRRPSEPPGSNILFCPDFVSMIHEQEGAASRLFLQKLPEYQTDGVEVLNIVSSVWQNQNVERSKVILVTVEDWPMKSKPPAAVVVWISKGKSHDLGAAAPFSTTTSSLQGRAGGLIFLPKLVEHIGSGPTRLAERLCPCISCTALAAPSVRSRVFLSAYMPASMAILDCRASCSRLAKSYLVPLISSASSSNFLSNLSKSTLIIRYTSASVGWPDPNSFCWRTGSLPSGTALFSFRGMLGQPSTSRSLVH